MESNTREVELLSEIAELRANLYKTKAELDELKYREKIFEKVIDKIPVDVFIKDPSDSFRYIYCNQSFMETQGSGNTVVGKDDYEVFSDAKDAAYLRNDDIKVLSEGRRFVYEESYTNQNGFTSIILVFKEPIELKGYPQPLLLGTSIDLSYVPNLSQVLLKKFEDVDKVSKTQTVKIANLRHEIKTPLTAIVGFTNILNDSTLKLSDDERENFIRLVNSNTELLQSIVNEILNKPQTNLVKEAPHRKEFDLYTMLKDVYTIYEPKLRGTDIKFVFRKIGESPKMLRDESKLLQVVYNLMNNAIKYTKKGSITLGYERMDDDNVRIFVNDTGAGIAKENFEKIFNRFEKLGSTKEGYGLGLSIVKSITEAVGGHCFVESEVGKGSHFFVEIPIR